jgi:hypothetical protein
MMSMTTQHKAMSKNMSGMFLGVQPPQSNLATITAGVPANSSQGNLIQK